jgi:hypothetical protein
MATGVGDPGREGGAASHRQAARLGLRGSLVARVSRDRWGGVSVEIRSGRLVFAEILDRNRDGRADLILVARA